MASLSRTRIFESQKIPVAGVFAKEFRPRGGEFEDAIGLLNTHTRSIQAGGIEFWMSRDVLYLL